MRFYFAAFIAIASSTALADDTATCRKKLKASADLGVLYALDWQKSKPPHVVAGHRYYQMPFDAKEGFADNVSCFLTGKLPPQLCINFEIKHWQTGKATEKYQNCRLKPI